jgi:hypothetical protein
MKGLAYELAAGGRFVNEDELVEYILVGLDGHYNPHVPSFDALVSISAIDLFC